MITRNQSIKKTRSHILIHFYFNKQSKYHSHSSFLLPSFTLSPHNKAVRPPFSQSTHHSLLPFSPYRHHSSHHSTQPNHQTPKLPSILSNHVFKRRDSVLKKQPGLHIRGSRRFHGYHFVRFIHRNLRHISRQLPTSFELISTPPR